MNDMSTPDAIDWNDYSTSFLSVMPSAMIALNREAASHLTGNSVDFGCGAGKLIPFAMQNANVSSYTGIDASTDMVRKARWTISRFNTKPATILESRIESVEQQGFDSGVSINSHYTWSNPAGVLSHIRQRLKPDSPFVLASINANLDMQALLDSAEAECFAHPHWSAFREHNMAISHCDGLHLPTLDKLIEEVSTVGFRVREAHQKHYLGGLNFLVLST